MEKISFFLNEKNKISSFQDSVKVIIYEKEESCKKGEEFIIDINELNNMKSLRKYFTQLVKKMDDCKIVVVKKAQGIPYGIFYEADYSIWELSGEPEEFLDFIFESEAKHIEEIEEKENESVVKELEQGKFFIDLNELQFTKPELTSKKAIIPFLDGENFDILEVLCCHVPPWLIERQKNNEIMMQISQLKKNEYKLSIKKAIKIKSQNEEI